MNEPISSAESLRDILSDASDKAPQFIWDVNNSVCTADLLTGTWIDGGQDLSGKSVLIFTDSQCAAALAMPATINFVPALNVVSSGKVARRDA